MLCFSEVILLILLILKARGVHGISNKCGSTKVCREYDCTHQLQAAEKGQSCEMRFPDSLDECEYNPKRALESSLRVNLTMFYRGNGLPGKVAFNLTLQGIYSNTTKFRFHNTKFDECDLCRQVHLNNVDLPHKGQLHWNCTFFEEPFYTNSNIELAVMDGRGGGNQYSFRVPEGVRTNGRANETTWQLYMLLHLSDVERESRLHVSLQLAPFGGINYTVALMKCTSGAESGCPENGTVVERKFLAGPVEAPTVARQEAVDFPVTEIGMYVVTAHIVSPRCVDCTFLSVSPPFALEANKLVPKVFGGAAALVLLVVALSGTCILCARHHRELKLELARRPVKVLLLYLADTHAYLEFVKELASFLADNCYVQVFMVDTHARKKSPYRWTTEHIAKSDRILFLLPADLHGHSITPIINQWDHALNHFTSSVRNRPCAATVVLPFSDEIPCQIFDLRRFRLLRDLPSMVTWTHHGAVTPNYYIMWRLHLNSLTPSLARVKSRMLQAMEEHRERKTRVTDRDASGSSAINLLLRHGESTRTSTSEDPTLLATNGLQGKQLPTEGCDDLKPGGEFDLMISSAEDLVGSRNRDVRVSSLASASEDNHDDNLPDSVFM
ncbi:uncharacterized protein LOC125035290 isoform X1 [Penaeus chinensis]|uniref:uncharacterized protein LOC125035290 isoform X1 n=2 Tax=Penaeus chinensis TaxID=139456 RepID=UPI001FB64B79|nr:uncharacterized protein LOC125035290 isoform X1 [Penaeus chinensis]